LTFFKIYAIIIIEKVGDNMATKVTPEIIEEINELYVELGVKAQVARKIGLSASTVSKYIIPNYIPKKDRVISTSHSEPTMDFKDFMGEVGKMGNMCVLSEEERLDLIELQKEVTV
jgi:hypothetical protein